MATGFFFKTSADAGAPSLTDTAGALIAVLDWVLDTAGGTHWEKVYSGTNKAVYRATTGERRYFRVDDTTTDVATINGYRTMSDVDTGTDPFPGPSTDFGYLRVAKCDNTRANADYYFVGDSQFFAGLIYMEGTYAWSQSFMAFGETNPFDPLDTYNTIICGGNVNTTSADWNNWNGGNENFFNAASAQFGGVGGTTATDPSESPGYFCGSINGVLTSVVARALSPAPDVGISMSNTSTAIGLVFPIYLIGGNGEGAGNDLFYEIRGRMPYIYGTSFAGGYTSINRLDTIEDGASEWTFLELGFSSSFNAATGKWIQFRTSNDEPGRA